MSEEAAPTGKPIGKPTGEEKGGGNPEKGGGVESGEGSKAEGVMRGERVSSADIRCSEPSLGEAVTIMRALPANWVEIPNQDYGWADSEAGSYEGLFEGTLRPIQLPTCQI